MLQFCFSNIFVCVFDIILVFNEECLYIYNRNDFDECEPSIRLKIESN